MESNYQKLTLLPCGVLDWMEPGVVAGGTWDDLAYDFSMGQKIFVQDQLAQRLHPEDPHVRCSPLESPWRSWPVEQVAVFALSVIGETIPPSRWAVPEHAAVPAAVRSLQTHDGDDGWRVWDEPEVLADLVGAIIGFPFTGIGKPTQPTRSLSLVRP